MNRDDIRKLVGGYATGTLTDAERALLFEAALDDQDLFDELADEHALKELLDEPGVRGRLAASLAPPQVPLRFRWWMRPWPVSALGAAALGVLVMVASLRTPETREIAAVISPPQSGAPASNEVIPEARFAAPQVPAPQNANAPAPPAAKGTPQTTGALAPAQDKLKPAEEERLKKDAGDTTSPPEPQKAEAPAAVVPPIQASESDRKEQTLADAVPRQGQQQTSPQALSSAPPQAKQLAQPQGLQQGQQQAGQQGALQPQQQTVVAQTESVVVTDQRRDQAAGGAAQTPPSAPAAAKPRALARQGAAKVAGALANALPAFTWTIENGVLRVTPARDGALRVEVLPQREAAPPTALVVANARRGVAARFTIPAEATSVRVVFSAPNVSADALSGAVNQRAGSRAAGSVSMPADAPNGPVSIEIPLR